MKTLCLGDIRVDRIVEVEQPFLTPWELFPAVTSEQVARHGDWLLPRLLDASSGHLVLSLHSFLIRTPKLNIIVDTCSGNHKPRPQKLRYHQNDWPYLERLGAAGIHPDEVDYVLCTHLHVDHIGWNTRLEEGHWVPTFRNAKYLFGRVEWEFWSETLISGQPDDTACLHDSVLPIFVWGQAELIETNYAFSDEIWLRPSPGHTPGQVCAHIRAGDVEAVLSGDVMHHPLQCAEPQLSSCFCVDPALSARTRMAFLEHSAEVGVIVLPAHFPAPTAGRVTRALDAFRFEFLDAVQ